MHRYRAAVAALFDSHAIGMIGKLVALLTLAASPLAASAAPNGLAWDSVNKLLTNTNPASLQPGSFDADYAAAAAVQAPESGSGGIFGGVKQAMAMGKMAQQMMTTGIAQRHYVAGSKERTDDLYRQTASIVDCNARTITTLDLRHKTYRIASMDEPAAQSPGASAGPQSESADNGTRIALSVANTALGSRDVGGQPTNGFRSAVTITETNSSNQSSSQNVELFAYFSAYAIPAPACSRLGIAGGQGPRVGGYAIAGLMNALFSGGHDSRFSIKQSGPSLPLGKLAMYDALTLGAQANGNTIVSERGNVRPIAADDPVFGIPSGFTQQQ